MDGKTKGESSSNSHLVTPLPCKTTLTYESLKSVSERVFVLLTMLLPASSPLPAPLMLPPPPALETESLQVQGQALGIEDRLDAPPSVKPCPLVMALCALRNVIGSLGA